MMRMAAVSALALALAAPSAARAQDYPTHPVKLILPQPPGGAVDLIARSLADRLTEQMHQPVIVENRPGANGGLAAGDVTRSNPDGYTLMVAVDTNLVVNPTLYPELQYAPFRDFTPISVLASVELVLMVNANVPVDNVRGLIAYASANPGKLNYASIGLGTQQHLGMELFKLMTKTDINQVEYRGSAAAMTDLAAGHVEVMINGPSLARPLAQAGKLKLLAVTGKQPSPYLPGIPTVDESGVPGFEVTGWFGMVAPAATPNPILDRLTAEVQKATADPKFRDRMSAQGLDPVGSTPAEMLALMQSDTKKWAAVIKATGAKVQ